MRLGTLLLPLVAVALVNRSAARLRGDIAAEEQWRIEAAIRHAAIVRARLQAQIAALEE